MTSVLVAVATALVLWWFGVENFAIWGLLAGVFNSVPYLGPVMVTGGLAVVTFMQFDDLLKTTYVAGATLLITSLEGWLLTPALMSRAAQMNPVAIFIGLLFWSWVWGVWGTILAVPMMMAIKATCDRIEGFEAVGELLGEERAGGRRRASEKRTRGQQPDQQRHRGDGHHRQQGETDPHEHVVPASRRHARARMPFEQRQVAHVRLPTDIDEIAEQRHQAEQHVERRVQHHARLHDDRQPHAHRLHQQQAGEHRGASLGVVPSWTG
jgi:hypothetical protein